MDTAEATRLTTDGPDAHGQDENRERDGLGQETGTGHNRDNLEEEPGPTAATGRRRRRPKLPRDLDPAHHPVLVSTRPHSPALVLIGGC